LKTFTETLYGLTLRHREPYESNASSVKSVGAIGRLCSDQNNQDASLANLHRL